MKINKFRLFWGWEDHKEEAWLHELSQQGFHLKTVHGMGFYTFERGASGDYVYRLDFQDKAKKELDDYLQLFEDAGWEHLSEGLGWHYFRKPVEQGRAEEIYTDPASKTQKYKRMQIFLLSTLPGQLIVLFMAIFDEFPAAYTPYLIGFFALIVAFYIFALLKINTRIRELKRR